ncbi:hypothetical protein CENSYa_1210 [Cenarchaeum symbiosum A]|uniref:Uncharacterized protein n=1 Tax=Cenarchaeum symbiosum (strain A) TaxID=414004 RepID=A0RWW7_CENSY|nr:hypothetical protein CENSYa_1210 [Cenarchaeum symbiosum A]
MHLPRITGNTAANRLIVVALIILTVVGGLGAFKYDYDKRLLWPFENSTYHGAVEDHMDEIRTLPEVEAFHAMYEGHEIIFLDRTKFRVSFSYTARDDDRGAVLFIRYYDREPSSFEHNCFVPGNGQLFSEDGVRTDCFSYVVPDDGAP